MKRSLYLLLISFLAFSGAIKAQDTIQVDIGLEHLPSDQIQLWLVPNGNKTGYFSSITWTLRWDDASTVTLGEFQPSPAFASILPGVLQQGPTVDQDGFHHAIYAAVPGSNSITFEAGVPVAMGFYDVIGGASNFELTNDAWTATNNGLYYVSINGIPSTGEIIELTTAVEEPTTLAPAAILAPNPSNGSSRLSLQLDHSGMVNIRVLDMAGRTVQEHRMAANEGAFSQILDADGQAEGTYTLLIDGPGFHTALPWILLR